MPEKKSPAREDGAIRDASHKLARSIEQMLSAVASVPDGRTAKGASFQAGEQDADGPGEKPSRAAAHLSQYLNVVNKHKGYVFLCCVACLMVGVFVVASKAPEYRATATVMLGGRRATTLPEAQGDYVGWGRSDFEYMRTQKEIIRGRKIARAAILKLELMKHEEFQRRPGPVARVLGMLRNLIGRSAPTTKVEKKAQAKTAGKGPRPLAAVPEEAFTAQDFDETRLAQVPLSFVGSYLGRIAVKRRSGTSLMDLTFRGYDPLSVTRAANAHAKAYIAYHKYVQKSAAGQSKKWLGDIGTDYAKELAAKRRRLLEQEEKADGILLERMGREADVGVVEGGEPAARRGGMPRGPLRVVPQGESIISRKVAMAVESVTKAEQERSRHQAVYEKLQELRRAGKPVEGFSVIRDDPLITELRKGLASRRTEADELSQRLGPRHPKAVRIKERVAAAASRIDKEIVTIVDNIKHDYEVALAEEAWAQKRFEEVKRQAKDLRKRALEVRALKKEITSLERIVDRASARAQEAGLTASAARGSVLVQDYAEVPSYPSNVRNFKIMAMAALCGIGLGLGLAFFIEYWRQQNVKNPEDIEELLQARVLGTVVQKTDFPLGLVAASMLKSGGGEATGEDSRSTAARGRQMRSLYESFRRIRTSLLGLQMLRDGHKAIMFTSTIPREGKTSISANVAASLAESGRKVLLLDGDTRKPRLDKLLFGDDGQEGEDASGDEDSAGGNLKDVWRGMIRALRPGQRDEDEPEGERGKEVPGLKTYLAGRHDLDEILRETPVPNLSFIACGSLGEKRDSSTSELLDSARLGELISRGRERFDMVVIDSPPVASVTDPLIIAKHCDGVIWVCSCNLTPRRTTRGCVRDLRQHGGRLLGAVGNRFTRYDTYGYYYGYHSYYYYDSEGRRTKRRRRRRLPARPSSEGQE